MRKFYLLLLATLLGGAIANAQSPLEGYEAPTYPKEGNVGNIVSFSTSGALEDLTKISIPKTPIGKIAQELLVAPGATVEFTININTWWGKFAVFSDANETKEMTRLIYCGNPGNAGFENADNGVTVFVEDNTTKQPSGTLPSITVPASAEEGTVYLFRMMFFGDAPSTDSANPTYNGTYSEGTYYDVKITVQSEIARYAINFNTPENGTLTVKNGETAITSGDEIAEGTILTITATPQSGYELVSVKKDGEIYPKSTYSVTAAATFTAEFQTLATEGEAMLMTAPGYGAEEAQLRFSDTVLGDHNTERDQVSSDQRPRNYTFSAWVSPIGYNGVFMGHVQNSITWSVEGSYGIGVQDGKLAVWYRIWDGSTTACAGAAAPAVSETTTFYPGEFAFITLVTSNNGNTFKVYKNGEEAISQEVGQGGLALLYDACDFAIGDSKYNQMASKVEEVQLWNKTLTPEEIKASMYGFNEIPEGLIAYYRPESATETTVENLAGDINAYYRKNGTLSSNSFPMASAVQKTNGRETVNVTYNTPAEENAAYELQRYGVALAESPATVKTYSNLYAVNQGETYKIDAITVDGTPLNKVTDPIQVGTSDITVNVTFSPTTGIEEIAAESIYFSNNTLYMPEGATAVIYNLLGSAVAETAEPAANLSNLPSGIYLAKISIDGNHSIIRFKK